MFTFTDTEDTIHQPTPEEDAVGEDAAIHMGMLDSLRIQFYAQICNFKNGRTKP